MQFKIRGFNHRRSVKEMQELLDYRKMYTMCALQMHRKKDVKIDAPETAFSDGFLLKCIK